MTMGIINAFEMHILSIYVTISFWIERQVFEATLFIFPMNFLTPRLGVAASSSDIDNPSGVATAVATTNYHSLSGPSYILLMPPDVRSVISPLDVIGHPCHPTPISHRSKRDQCPVNVDQEMRLPITNTGLLDDWRIDSSPFANQESVFYIQ